MADLSLFEKNMRDLLDLESVQDQVALLRTRGLADEEGLGGLLAYAENLARHDPMQARAAAQFCEEAASAIDAPTLAPRALYLRAQTHVLRGDAGTALELIESAREQFLALNMAIEALRTDVGAMNTLTALGRYEDALEISRAALIRTEAMKGDTEQESAADLELIRAKIYVNQGPALSEMGRFDEALIAYAEAEAIYESLQMIDDRVLVLSNRGVALRYLGRVDEALHAYERAAALLPRSGYLYALMQNNIGDAYLLLGDYQSSLTAFAESRREFEAQDAELDLQICISHTADAYLALNLYPEALDLYQDAVRSLKGSEYRYYLGKALWGIGSVHLALFQLDEAAAALIRALELFSELGNVPICAQIMLEQSALHDLRGDGAVSLQIAHQALALIDEPTGARWPVQQVYAHLRLADLRLADAEIAERHLRQVEALLAELPLPQLRYRFYYRLGRVRRLQGQDEEALQLFETAIGEAEQLRSSLADEAMLVSFQQDKMEAHEALIQLYLERITEGQYAEGQYDDEAIERVFDSVERSKSRALVERLSGLLQTLPAGGGDEESRKRMQRIEQKLNAIYSEMLGQDIGDPDDQETRGGRLEQMALLGRRARDLEQALSHLRLETASGMQALGIGESSLTLRQIQQRLPGDLTLLSYHICGDEVLAFVVTQEAVRVVRRMATPAAVEEQIALLAAHWNHLRMSGIFIERHMAALERNAQRLLQRLYHALVAPLAEIAGLEAGDPLQRLVIVPHGLLHQVPFQALYDGERYLIEQAELSYAPSATIMTLCQERMARLSSRLLVMGVADPAIPAVEAETRAIALTFPEAEIFMNEQANLKDLRSNVSGCGILHLACHGIFRADSPSFSALKLYDGWLTAAESVQLELDGALVVLSACESGRGAVLAGDETIGLVRAFLGAGAATLAVSQWLVQDDTGAMLMAEWYGRLARGQSLTASLRAAQLALKSSHPHPYYWAPFVLIGSRGVPFNGRLITQAPL